MSKTSSVSQKIQLWRIFYFKTILYIQQYIYIYISNLNFQNRS